MPSDKKLQFRVNEKDQGKPLVSVLKNLLDRHSAKEIKRAIEQKACLVNGRVPFFSSYKVSSGDVIEFSREKNSVEDVSVQIIHEDEDFLVVNKSSGLISDEKTLKTRLGRDVYLVHRLDKETSGILLLGKNSSTQKLLEKQFREHLIFKCYLALVSGKMHKNEGTIENYLGVISRFDGGAIWGKVDPKRGKYAKTKWVLLRAFDGYSLVCCFPYTGRTHQIRAHMSQIGHPLLGDARYGKGFKQKTERILLHSYRIEFMHPKKKKHLQFEQPLPSDMNKFLKTKA